MHMEAPFLRCASSDDLEGFKVDLSAEDTRFEPEFHLCNQEISWKIQKWHVCIYI